MVKNEKGTLGSWVSDGKRGCAEEGDESRWAADAGLTWAAKDCVADDGENE